MRSPERSSGRRKGAARPDASATCAISSWSVETTARLWVRCLLAGRDTMAVIIVNDDIASDRVGTVVKHIEQANVNVHLPSWLAPNDVFEISHAGIQDADWKHTGPDISLSLDRVELTRFILISSDRKLRSRLRSRYRTQFAASAAKLLAPRSK